MRDKPDIKDVIKSKAIELFSEKGFHGTTVRDIAHEAGCSLPMLYYYYNNKNDLFEEIVYNEFLSLIERLNNAIQKGLPLEETYFLAVKQRKELSPYEKAVYKLAMKVWHGFDGGPEIRKKLVAWEKGRYERNREILSEINNDEALLDILTNVVLSLFENYTEKIIIFNEDIPDEKIRRELSFIMNCFAK